MIISRTAFKLKYGQAKPAIALWKEMMAVEVAGIEKNPVRLLTDASGQHYMLVMEMQLRSFTDMGPSMHAWGASERIRELYPQFTALCVESRGDLYHLEQQNGNDPAPGSIVERMEFHLKFGQARESIAIWKELLAFSRTKTEVPPMRLLSDITGPSYRLIMEMSYKSMMDFGPKMSVWMTEEKFRELYARFVPLCERSERTLFKLEHVG